MGCLCDNSHTKQSTSKKLHFTHHQRNKAQFYETVEYTKRAIQNQQKNEYSKAKCKQADYVDEIGHFIVSKIIQLSNNINNRTHITNNSHCVVRHTLGLYAASSVILALCYLTTSAAASDVNPMFPVPMPQAGLPEGTNPQMQHKCKNDTFHVNNTRFDESCSDKEILDHLLQSTRYDKRLLPPVNDEDFCCGLSSPEMANNLTSVLGIMRPHNRGTLTVNVNVLLLSLASPDESSLKYEVEFLLNQQWNDPRLQYGNRSQYDYLNAIHHHGDIWLPDTYFIMHGDFKDPINPMHFALRIYRNGTITYAMRRHLILSCQGNLNIFPFDDPLCSFSMESISYELSAIKYVWKNGEDTLRKSPSLNSLNAYLIQNSTILCPHKNSWRGNYSCLKVDLMFTRDRAFYFTTVFIPGIILVTSSFITFWLEWNAVPARVMIGVTTMLNFFTTSNSFRGTLPVVSNLTAMNVWDGVCMCFIYASLLEFVCVNYVGRKRPLHNVVYRPGENPVTQEMIEREFLAAVSAEKRKHQNQMAAKCVSKARPSTNAPETKDADDSVQIKPTQQLESSRPTTPSPTPVVVTTWADVYDTVEKGEEQCPVPPPRRKVSRRTTPIRTIGMDEPMSLVRRTATDNLEIRTPEKGEKKRDTTGPNEIVACTSCAGGTSPCTHSANNGCATETCFVQVRKKEPPHPIRVAKTIDVIARITFPTAYAIFLIFFFIHYKGFS